jgi:hypothetical protein
MIIGFILQFPFLGSSAKHPQDRSTFVHLHIQAVGQKISRQALTGAQHPQLTTQANLCQGCEMHTMNTGQIIGAAAGDVA